jgi:hypothetical protein
LQPRASIAAPPKLITINTQVIASPKVWRNRAPTKTTVRSLSMWEPLRAVDLQPIEAVFRPRRARRAAVVEGLRCPSATRNFAVPRQRQVSGNERPTVVIQVNRS